MNNDRPLDGYHCLEFHTTGDFEDLIKVFETGDLKQFLKYLDENLTEGYVPLEIMARGNRIIPKDHVQIPENADEAVGMALVGMNWLEHHAPDRLTDEHRNKLQQLKEAQQRRLQDKKTDPL